VKKLSRKKQPHRQRILGPVFGLLIFCAGVISPGVHAATKLPYSVQSALDVRGVPADALSIFVQEVDSGDTVLAWNDDVLRNPASVEKMLTTLAALDILGPTYRWKTDVRFNGEVTDGVLNGDILLKGYGDPYLVTERFWQLLRQVRQQGVHTITGDLLIDDSYFEVGAYDPAAFDNEPLRAYNVAPHALLTNFKVVRYYFEPVERSTDVRVWFDPALENLEVINNLKVTPGSCRGYQRGISIIPNDDISQITFSGKFPSGCEVFSMSRTVLDHNAFTFGLFETLWRQTGGEFSGHWKTALADETVEPALSFDSLPLSEIITKVNKHSNNVMAKHLLFTVGAEKFGTVGSEERGRKAVYDWLAANDLDHAGLQIGNGAGLSRGSRISANQLAAILQYGYDSPYMPEYLSSLALSGLDGTLRKRFGRAGLKGQAHLKTGSLDHVSALAGFFQSRSGKRYIVAALLNHSNVHKGPGREVQEMLLRWLYDL